MMKTRPLAELSVLVLAGGKGTRLRSVIADRPKALASINNRPFLSFLLDQLIASGVRHVVLCTGFMAGQLLDLYGPTYGTLELAYSREANPLGTAGAVRQALSVVRSDPALVMNGDSYCQADLESFYLFHKDVGAKASLYLSTVADSSRYGQVHVDGQNRITQFVEKGGNSGPGWISAGIYLLNKELVADIPTGRSVSIEQEIFPNLIGRDFYGYQGKGRFIDIGTPESYRQAEAFFSDMTARG